MYWNSSSDGHSNFIENLLCYRDRMPTHASAELSCSEMNDCRSANPECLEVNASVAPLDTTLYSNWPYHFWAMNKYYLYRNKREKTSYSVFIAFNNGYFLIVMYSPYRWVWMFSPPLIRLTPQIFIRHDTYRGIRGFSQLV